LTRLSVLQKPNLVKQKTCVSRDSHHKQIIYIGIEREKQEKT